MLAGIPHQTETSIKGLVNLQRNAYRYFYLIFYHETENYKNLCSTESQLTNISVPKTHCSHPT